MLTNTLAISKEVLDPLNFIHIYLQLKNRHSNYFLILQRYPANFQINFFILIRSLFILKILFHIDIFAEINIFHNFRPNNIQFDCPCKLKLKENFNLIQTENEKLKENIFELSVEFDDLKVKNINSMNELKIIKMIIRKIKLMKIQ